MDPYHRTSDKQNQVGSGDQILNVLEFWSVLEDRHEILRFPPVFALACQCSRADMDDS